MDNATNVAAKCIGMKTNRGNKVPGDRTIQARVISGWVHVDLEVFGEWVYLGAFYSWLIGIPGGTDYMSLGIHRVEVKS